MMSPEQGQVPLPDPYLHDDLGFLRQWLASATDPVLRKRIKARIYELTDALLT